MTKYAITGATGKFGQAAYKKLSELVSKNDIILLARNVDKAKSLVADGVEVRPGDYTDVASLTQSLRGVDRLLFISSIPGAKVAREVQHANVVKAAQDAGVQFIAYTSFPDAQNSAIPLAADHKATEQLIEQAQIQHSFLRNNWYLENEAATLQAANDGQPFVYSAGDGRVGWALEREYAEAAAIVLASANSEAVYELAGVSRTYADLAAAMPGKVQVLSVDDEQYRDGLLQAGLDQATAALVTSFQTMIRAGNLAENTTDLVDVLGHDLVPIADAIQEVVK